jgi:hypothetical protein
LDRKGKQKAAEIASDPEQLRVMRIVRAQQRLKSVKTPHVLTHCLAKSGSAAALSQ